MRRRLAILVLVPAVLLVAAVVFVFVQDPDRYREDLAQLLSETAGYPVELGGPLELSWRPSPTLTVRDARMVTPEARVTVAVVRVEVESTALLARRLRARDVVAEGVRIQLSGAPVSSAVTALPNPSTLPVDRVELADVEFRRGDSLRLGIRRLVMSDPDSADGARVLLDVPSPMLRGEVRVKVAGSQVHIVQMDVDTAAGSVGGQLTLTLDNPRSRLTGSISANALAWPVDARGTPGPVIPRVALDPAVLAMLNVDVTTRVGRLSLGDLRLSGVELPLVVDAGALEVRASAELAGGSLGGRFTLEPGDADGVPRLAMNAMLDGADAGAVLVMLGAGSVERGGRLTARSNLSARGADTQAVLSTLGGEIAVDARDVTVRANAAELAASDVFAGLMRTLRDDENRRVQVECAVARFTARQGVLGSNGGIGLQSRATNVIGGGRIALREERMDLLLRPWPREGLGLSATAVVGSLAVSGPIADPEVTLTSEALWRGGATAGAAVLTGGLSLIAQGLLERARGDAPCDDAAGVRGAAPRGVAVEVQEAGSGIGGLLKGLLDSRPVDMGAEGDRADR